MLISTAQTELQWKQEVLQPLNKNTNNRSRTTAQPNIPFEVTKFFFLNLTSASWFFTRFPQEHWWYLFNLCTTEGSLQVIFLRQDNSIQWSSHVFIRIKCLQI